MYSIGFPDMFSSTKTNLVSDHQATAQNILLMLKSDRTSLFGDPYFGTILKKLIYEQNDLILQDIVIDELYTSILTFMPQVRLSRNDIKLRAEKSALYATIKCTNLIDFQTDLYDIKLTNDEE